MTADRHPNPPTGTGARRRGPTNSPRGADNGRWNAGKLVDSQGYELVRAGVGAPGADSNGYVRKQRVVAAGKVGRALRPGEEAHHVDRNRGNNAAVNVRALPEREHKALERRHGVKR